MYQSTSVIIDKLKNMNYYTAKYDSNNNILKTDCINIRRIFLHIDIYSDKVDLFIETKRGTEYYSTHSIIELSINLKKYTIDLIRLRSNLYYNYSNRSNTENNVTMLHNLITYNEKLLEELNLTIKNHKRN